MTCVAHTADGKTVHIGESNGSALFALPATKPVVETKKHRRLETFAGKPELTVVGGTDTESPDGSSGSSPEADDHIEDLQMAASTTTLIPCSRYQRPTRVKNVKI